MGMGPFAGIASGAGGVAPAAAPAFGAFGSADMMASLAPNAGLIGAAGEAAGGTALPSLMGTEAPIPFNETMKLFGPNSEFVGQGIEGAGLTPNSYTGGFDGMNGLQRVGQRITGTLDQMGGNMNPMRMMNMGQPQQQPASRPPAMQRPQSQPETQVSVPYGQTISGGLQLTDEQKRMLMERMRGQYGLIG